MGNKIFTAHENPAIAEPSERVELVREGFSYLAMLFPALWFLVHRLWIETLAYLLLAGGVLELARYFQFPVLTVALLGLFLQVMAGSFAFDLRRAALARRGYALRGVVVAETALNAQRRYFDHIA